MSDIVLRARVFATAAHAAVAQVRKYTNEDYIVHPRAVSMWVKESMNFPHWDMEMIAAAWLHDVVEDTKVNLYHIRAEFGDDVAELVEQLTDISRPADGSRATRKEIDRMHTACASPRAKTIKLADLIDNTATITKYDPNFAKVYMAEKKLMLPLLKEGNTWLWKLANQLVENWDNREL